MQNKLVATTLEGKFYVFDLRTVIIFNYSYIMNKVLQILKKKHIKQQFGVLSIFLKIEMFLPQWEEMEI